MTLPLLMLENAAVHGWRWRRREDTGDGGGEEGEAHTGRWGLSPQRVELQVVLMNQLMVQKVELRSWIPAVQVLDEVALHADSWSRRGLAPHHAGLDLSKLCCWRVPEVSETEKYKSGDKVSYRLSI